MQLLPLSLVLCAVLGLSTGYRILALVPMPAKSHAILFERLVIELTKQGHDVTYVSAFPMNKKVPKLTEIAIPDLHDKLVEKDGDGNTNMFELRKASPLMMMFLFPKISTPLMEAILESDPMQKLIKSDQKFDLIIGEAFLNEGVLAGFSRKFNAPLITLATFMPTVWSNYMVGNPSPNAYIPNSWLGLPDKMCFTDRLYNTVFNLIEEAHHILYYLPTQDALMRKFFGNDLPHVTDTIKNTSLVLVNHHYSLAFPRPYLPNMVEIGGYHVYPPKDLPKDLKSYCDGSKDGFILFSMGSNLKSALMPMEKKQMFLNAFSKLKVNVIWKFEDDTLTNIPKNVKLASWLPQSDILAHPNIKLFITHGGLLSTTEAVNYEVPLVGIPIFGDQPINMRQVEIAGYGISLEYDDLTEDILVKTVNEVLNNPSYKENVKLRSAILRDTPLSAMDSALYWINYVARHKGAPHLKSAAQDLTWAQLYLVDVFAVLGLAAAVILYVEFKITRFIFRKIFCKKSCTSSKKAEKKTVKKNN